MARNAATNLAQLARADIAKSSATDAKQFFSGMESAQNKSITRADMANIFNSGSRGQTRKSAVAALKALGFGKTAAYEALAINGRFLSWLQFAPDGIITWKAD